MNNTRHSCFLSVNKTPASQIVSDTDKDGRYLTKSGELVRPAGTGNKESVMRISIAAHLFPREEEKYT